VYMLCRVFFLLNGQALEVIACIGGFTALLAALIAVQQNDIKRILAYSTLSQLGYMVMSVGLSGPTEAMFHLSTHAFFKALLFLAAGSIIVALHHEQNIWKMGALRKKMPVTFWTMLIGTLALSGIWPLSGFFSKDGILTRALEHPNHNLGRSLFAVGALVAVLTAFYMFRLVFVVFLGKTKSDTADHAHESPPVMLWPLRILALFSIIAGVIGLESAYARQFGDAVEQLSFLQQLVFPFTHAPVAAGIGLIAAIAGIAGAWALYSKADADPLPAKLGAPSEWMRDKFYFDELYEKILIPIHEFLAKVADAFDRFIIEGGFITLIRGGTDLFGRTLRFFQTGNLQTYALLFAMGVAVVLYFVLR
jgi:NADH-quinone oxidoreductase subunit L